MSRSHLRQLAVVLTLSFGMALPTLQLGCSAAQRGQEKKALEYSQTLCILEKSLLPIPAIALACKIEDALVPFIEPFLSAHQRAALRQYGPAASASASASSPVPSASVAPSAAPAVTSATVPVASASASASASAPAKKKKLGAPPVTTAHNAVIASATCANTTTDRGLPEPRTASPTPRLT